ncbi:MAG: DUF3810 domain-containing protein [Eubacteriales bacterium]|nr:DUF3810 domain-containing protein [Eubacteriales bacterium]
MIKTIYNKITKYCPLPALIIFCVFLISASVHVISNISVAFSDFFNRYISSFVRAVLAKFTNILPFSLAETIIMFLPVLFILMIAGSIAASRKSKESGVRYTTTLLAAATLFYSIFVLGFAVSYQGSTLESKLGIDRRNVSADELYKTSEILLGEIDKLVSDIDYKYGSLSVKPFTLNEMNGLLNDSYKQIANKYDFIPQLRTNTKFILLSEPMTYTHISGVYTYYTGEANININFPDYTLPYTAAHEMSHQRGIAREDEANFMAFLVCIASENKYIRYSGYLNMFEYVSRALYSADRDAYYRLMDRMDFRVRYEMISYDRFFDKYRKSVASEVSAAVNDTFLKSQGQTEGTKSYGMVVDLAVAYYIR